MKVIGFNFIKVNAERYAKFNLENLKINAKMDISSIESLKSTLLNTGEDIIGVEFVYSLQYEPDSAKIELAGNVICSLEPKLAKEILKEWKDKNIPEDFKMMIFNLILKKASLKSLELEDELGLPYHIPLPSLKKGNNQNKAEN
jgi:hypothetical protein